STLFGVRKGASEADPDILFSVSEEENYNILSTSFRFRYLDSSGDGFILSSAASVKFFDNSGSAVGEIKDYGWGLPDISQAVAKGDEIWIADHKHGFVRGKDMAEFSIITVNGPASNHVAAISSDHGITVVCGGGTDQSFNGLGIPFSVSVHSGSLFRNFVSETVTDAMKAVIMPGNGFHFFVSSWGGGLIEFRDNTPVNHYNGTNSPLSAAYGTPGEINISGMAVDKNGNLWMVHPGPGNNIKVLKPDKSWISLPALSNTALTGDMIITPRNLKIVIIPGGNGLFVLDDNNTPELSGDDRSRRIIIRDKDGSVINNALSLAADLDGNIWVGTDRGPVVYYSGTNFLEGDPAATRIRIPRDDGSGLADYLLGTTGISCIAVDGSNRKWLGTNGSGAWLITDGTGSVAANFSVKNSPLLSDTITSIAVDDVSGEVWFGTPAGLISFRGIATGGAGDFSGIYPFPNPVREDFDGNVTITGLMRNTTVKITDVSGNLVYETLSEGGQATWDLTTYKGRRVSTGVYVVFCSDSEGKQSGVTKILVVR
ncbi:MAG: T9SS type A sorting domain-containing protein, partial [Bacteroidales bacterium]|nr:T9SS type A sorting domain-containing protein [Bacteroidales bacterium]